MKTTTTVPEIATTPTVRLPHAIADAVEATVVRIRTEVPTLAAKTTPDQLRTVMTDAVSEIVGSDAIQPHGRTAGKPCYIEEADLGAGVLMLYREYGTKVRMAYDPTQITGPQARALLAMNVLYTEVTAEGRA